MLIISLQPPVSCSQMIRDWDTFVPSLQFPILAMFHRSRRSAWGLPVLVVAEKGELEVEARLWVDALLCA